MPELADIFRAAAPAYRAKYGLRMLPSHKRAIEDIILCPKCGNDDATQWLTAQNALLLPVPYFLVTSTLPAELRPLAHRHQKLIYGLLLRCTAEAIQKLAYDPQWVGGQIGLLGVLQTWKRNMEYHVHAHFIVPGGGLAPDGPTRLSYARQSRGNYPVR